MASQQDRQVTAAGKTLTIRFGLRAILALQDRWELDDEKQVEARIKASSTRDFPAIIWAALQTHHRDMSEDDVLTWLDEAGMDGMTGIAGQMEKAMESAQPPARPQGRRTTAPKTP